MGVVTAQAATISRRAPEGMKRARSVWLSLLAAMTSVGGLLLALDGRPAVRNDGVALPLAVAGQPSALEPVFRTRAPLAKGTWQAIVIHHSGSPVGSAASVEAEHRARNFRGLGHHFVIGNGRGMDDGELHVGYRWLDQLPGAHAGGTDGEWYNRHAISICVIGDGEGGGFSGTQMSRLAELTSALCAELNISPERVLLHSEIAPTTDPGRKFPVNWLRERLSAAR